MATAALALYLFAVLVNLIVLHYAAGVARSAVEEGARAGAAAPAGIERCEARAGEILEGLLGGSYGDGVTVGCVDSGGWVIARARVELAGLVPPVPTVRWEFEAAAAREDA